MCESNRDSARPVHNHTHTHTPLKRVNFEGLKLSLMFFFSCSSLLLDDDDDDDGKDDNFRRISHVVGSHRKRNGVHRWWW